MVMKNISWKMVKCKRWMLYGLIGICLLGGSSCSEKYDDTWIKEAIEDLQDRVTALEEWCRTANSNISSLQSLATALEECDYITGVTPVTEHGMEIGYTITFKNAPAIIIYHGQDGEKGDSASVPMIGVSKGDDGKYYWTQTVGDAEPEFILDEAGNKIAASGMAPRLSVDSDGYWLIDVDGSGFVRLKDVEGNDVKAVGEKGDTGDPGETGPQGPAGNSIFSKVDYSDPTYVIFYLNDGTKIQLPRYNLTDTQTEYDALVKAISEATGTPDNPTVIELTGDILMGENAPFPIDHHHIIIDGKGYKIKGRLIFNISNGSSLTLRNITLDGNNNWNVISISYHPIDCASVTTLVLDKGAVLQNCGDYAITIVGGKFQMNEGSVIMNTSYAFDGDVTQMEYESYYLNGGGFDNCILNIHSYIYNTPKIHISQKPQISNNGKIVVVVMKQMDWDTNVIGQIVAPVNGYQLILSDFDFIWPNMDPYEIFLDENDGIIKIRVGEQ